VSKGRLTNQNFCRDWHRVMLYNGDMQLRWNQPHWADMSDYVVHFVKPSRSRPIDPPHEWTTIQQILLEQRLRAMNRFGIALPSRYAHIPKQNVVCLSEVPLGQLARLVERRSRCGIGFRKQFLVESGGGPIMYAYAGTEYEVAIRSMMESNLHSPCADIWKLTPMVDSAGASRAGGTPYHFEWEREWRVIGDIPFETEAVSFLIIPEEHHKGVRCVLDGPTEDAPVYLCPIIDAHWTREHIQAAFDAYDQEMAERVGESDDGNSVDGE
jgi:hypothetical protein